MALWLLVTLFIGNIPAQFFLYPDQNAVTVDKEKIKIGNSLSGRFRLLWTFPGIDDVECVSPFWDVNGDGINDVLAESFDAGATGAAHLFCLSGASGDTIWAVWPSGGVSNSGGWGDQCVSFTGDLNGDGYGDALLGTAWGGRTVFALSGRDGAVIWSYDTYNDSIASGWVYCVSGMPDIDADSIPEVLAATGTYCQTVFCFSGVDGRILWRFYAQDAVGSVCPVRDVNGDGVDDVIAGAWGNSRDQRVYCISGASRGNQPQVLWSFLAAGDVYCVRAIPDVNRSGKDDVIASTWGNYIYCLEGGSGQVIWSYNIGTYGMRVELLDDINGDSAPEVIVGSWNPMVVLLDGRQGRELWRMNIGNNVWTVYPIGDVNGDGTPDVVAGCGAGSVFCLNGSDGAVIWSYSTGGWVNSVRSVADVDGDEVDDVIAGNQFSGAPGYVYCIAGDSSGSALREERGAAVSGGGGKIDGVYNSSGRRVRWLKSGVYFVVSFDGRKINRRKILVLPGKGKRLE